MSDVPSFNSIDLPVLEATALLCSQGVAPDDNQIRTLVPALGEEEIRQGLVRLIERGYVTGNPIGTWQAAVPPRVVNLQVTSAGLERLSG